MDASFIYHLLFWACLWHQKNRHEQIQNIDLWCFKTTNTVCRMPSKKKSTNVDQLRDLRHLHRQFLQVIELIVALLGGLTTWQLRGLNGLSFRPRGSWHCQGMSPTSASQIVDALLDKLFVWTGISLGRFGG